VNEATKEVSFGVNRNLHSDVAGAATAVVSAQQGKVVSSYGPTNQDVTFDQIKAMRMAVKAERAKQHMELLAPGMTFQRKALPSPLCQGENPSLWGRQPNCKA